MPHKFSTAAIDRRMPAIYLPARLANVLSSRNNQFTRPKSNFFLKKLGGLYHVLDLADAKRHKIRMLCSIVLFKVSIDLLIIVEKSRLELLSALLIIPFRDYYRIKESKD